MIKKIKKAIPWFLVASILLVGLIVGLNFRAKNVKAGDEEGAAGTSATVTNSAPTWTANASEDPDSTGASPTNVGDKVYFTAQASDPNGEQWYLAICKEGNGATAGDNTAPTCTSGGEWIICGPYDDDHTIGATECGYTTLVGDAESKDWYGYICDKHAGGGACNAAEQSTNDPFKVNHRPTITSVSTTTDDQDPDGTFVIETVASDGDTDTTPDTLTVYVCRTNAVSGIDCEATQEVCSTIGDASPDVICDYDDIAPTEDTDYTYYAFIWDNHGFAAADNSKTSIYTVNNVKPVISNNVVLDGATEITLSNESSTTDKNVTGTVTDQNGCADIVLASTKTDIFTTDMEHDACNISAENDDDDCYAEITCTRDTDTCTGDGRDDDADADYTCTVSFQYHAQPTVANTPWAAYKWTAFLNSADEALDADSVEVGTQVEMNDFVALDVTDSIPYGSLAVGAIAGGTALPETTTVTATGNTALDLKLHATKKMCDDYDTCSEESPHTPMAQSQQHYAASGTWTDGNPLASELPTPAYQLNCKKSDTEDLTETADVKWGLQVPDLTLSGSYEGSNTFTGIMGDSPEDTEW